MDIAAVPQIRPIVIAANQEKGVSMRLHYERPVILIRLPKNKETTLQRDHEYIKRREKNGKNVFE